jgi:hypothetical protein
MEEPLEVGYAFCEVCQTMRSGDLHRELTDKTKGLFYYYICREPDKQGVRHTFSVATAKSIEELKDKNTEAAKEALNKIKTQNRSNDAMKVLGLTTAAFFIVEGIAVAAKDYASHHGGSSTTHSDIPDHSPSHGGVDHDSLAGGHHDAGSHGGGVDHGHSNIIHEIVRGTVEFIVGIFKHS